MSTKPVDVSAMAEKGRKLCHDINQPLTVISARADLLLMKMAPEDAAYHSITQIKQSVVELSELVNQVHAMFRDMEP